jgi:hypothetical protein
MDSAMSLVRIGRICLSACGCEYEALQTLETCALNERVESSETPRVEIVSDWFTTDPGILIPGIEGKWWNRYWVPKRMANTGLAKIQAYHLISDLLVIFYFSRL